MAGIEGMPVYLLTEDDPRKFDEEQMLSGMPPVELIDRLVPGSASTWSTTRLPREKLG